MTLASVVQRLGASKAKDVLAIVDSCFSGEGGRSVLPPGARALVRVQETPVTGGVAVFTAASGAETSGPAPGGADGLFTQYVLQGLGTGAADIDGNGSITLDELATWVKPRVSAAATQDHRDQHPSLVVGSTLGTPANFIVEWGLPQAH